MGNPIQENNACDLSLEVQEFVGSQKEFRIECNKIHLRIIGSNNRILLNMNDGKLEITGNSCKVKIATNNGQISYLGDNGKIYLGRASSTTKVHYTGMNGSVCFSDKIPLIEKSMLKTKSNNIGSKVLSINVKNNISLPNLAEIVENQTFNCKSSFKIYHTTGSLCVTNFFKKPAVG